MRRPCAGFTINEFQLNFLNCVVRTFCVVQVPLSRGVPLQKGTTMSLIVEVLGARNLVAKKKGGVSDPFVVIIDHI